MLGDMWEGHTGDRYTLNPKSIYYVGKQSMDLMNQNAQHGNTYNPH